MSVVSEITTRPPKTLTNNYNGQHLKPHPISVKEYDEMIEKGIYDENDQIELLGGIIVEKMPKGNEHSIYNDIVATYFIEKLSRKVYVRNQNPIWLDEYSKPEPDIVLAVPPFSKYFNSPPTPNEIFLVLEVSDTTLGYDRNTKAEAYARAGIQQYLVLNVQDKTVEDYREPSDDGFQSKQTHRIGQEFNLVAFPEISIAVSDFLPVEKE